MYKRRPHPHGGRGRPDCAMLGMGKFVPRIASCWTGSFGPDAAFSAISGNRQQDNACDRQLCSVDYARVNPRRRERQQDAQSCCSDGRLLQVGVAVYIFHGMISKYRNHEMRKKRQGSQESVAEEQRWDKREEKRRPGWPNQAFCRSRSELQRRPLD